MAKVEFQPNTLEMKWFSGCCGFAVQPNFSGKVSGWSEDIEGTVKRIEELEISAAKTGSKNWEGSSQYKHGALVCTITDSQSLFKALKLRKWRMVTRFKNPAHGSNYVSMWVKPLVEEELEIKST